MDALSEAVATKFSLTSKEGDDVEAADLGGTTELNMPTFDVVGRVVSDKKIQRILFR